MKIAKVLVKIAHELDESGLSHLADKIDSIALSLTDNGLAKFAREGNWQAMLEMIKRPNTNPNEAENALNRIRALVEKGKFKPEVLAEAEKAMSARKRATSPVATRATAPQGNSTGLVRQPAVKAISVPEAALKMNPSSTPKPSWRAGFNPGKPSAGAGLLGGAVGGHAGAAIGKAVGGETGEMIGGLVGGVVGGTIAQTPAGKALLAGWVIGTAINNIPGFSDKVQGAMDSILGNADAGHDELQLKGMLDIFNRLQPVVDNQDLPLETRAKKLESLRGLITNIANHTAAEKVLGADGIAKMKDLGVKIDTGIAAASKAAPANAAPAAKAPRKIQPNPKIRTLQANLNKLFENGLLNLSAKLAEDGIVGRLTRAAISAFDPSSNGRVTTELLSKATADAAAASPAAASPAAASPSPGFTLNQRPPEA